MKNYKINFAANTVTVTKDFLKKAEQLGTVEFNTMMELRKLGMTITIKQQKKHKKPEFQLTYKKMEQYISCLNEAEGYLAMFRQVKETAKGTNNPYLYVQNWFKATFPNYDTIPELTPDFRIVASPVNYDESEAA